MNQPPLSPELLEQLKSYDTPTICNGLENSRGHARSPPGRRPSTADGAWRERARRRPTAVPLAPRSARFPRGRYLLPGP